ncbi:MAG: ABC transporter ATP-binding protein, partial [Dehalococcoidia bacterium]|nr:ABC transporter ATP-binding protein [Dehalococcoidia bacterium]
DIPKEEAQRRSAEVLALFELQTKANSNIRELSGGMKRRLMLARALINNPRIIVMDEPTVGLDPQARHLVWRKLSELKSQGVTQLLCTQNMEEAAVLCDRVAIMHQGRILNISAPKDLIQKYAGDMVWEIDVLPETRDTIVRELQSYKLEFEDFDGRIHVFHADSDERIKGLIVSFPGKVRRRTATLEDVFLRLTGRSLIE